MSVHPKVNELEHLIDTDPNEETFRSAAEQAAAILDELAGLLRDPKERERLGGTTLPTSVGRAVAIPLPQPSSANYAAQLKLVTQAARVAANLAADCDMNRTALAHAGFPSSAVSLLATRPALPIGVLRPLVASIMNLTVEGHESCVKAVGSQPNFATIVQLAGEIYTPGVWDGAETDTRSVTAGWLWTIADSVIPSGDAPHPWSLSLADLRAFLPALAGFAPRNVSSDSRGDDAEQCGSDLVILAHATSVLDRFNAADKLDHAAIMADKGATGALLDFVELAVLPPWVEWEEEPAEDEEEVVEDASKPAPGQSQEKTLGVAKAAVARTIVSLLAESEPPQWVWSRVDAWLDKEDRPDLIACALLSYGNKARSDSAATALLTPSLSARLIPLMTPTTPLLTQHALIGLLRNLSIPAANKQTLGAAGVLEKLVAMEPWAEPRDVVGSVQGGAVGVVKNLVREPSNATRFLATPGVGALHALIKRTNDGAIAMEGSRVWVNAVRALAQRPAAAGAGASAAAGGWETLCTPAVVADLCAMLSRGETYPVLVNEGVLALALLVAYGHMGDAVASALAVDPNAGVASDAAAATEADTEAELGAHLDAGGRPATAAKARSASRVLASVLAPTPARPVGPEVQANTLALVCLLPRTSAARVLVLDAVREAQDEGRSVAAGVEVLEAQLE